LHFFKSVKQADAEKSEESRQKKNCLAMKKLNLEQMEKINGGLTRRQAGCFYLGLATGIASGMNPVVGGLSTLACFLLH
jgi:hypothetical protein